MERLKKIRFAIIGATVLLLILVGVVLFNILSRLVISNYQMQMTTKLAETDKNLDKSLDALEKNNESFDRLQTINTEFAVYYVKEDKTTGFSQASMTKLAKLLSVQNVILLDQDGNIITSAYPVEDGVDFTEEGAKSILDVVYTGTVSDPIYFYDDEKEEVDYPVVYFSAMIDPQHILVIEADESELENLSDSASSWRAVMERNTIGQKGFTFAVNTDGYFAYFPYDPTKGKDTDYVGLSDQVKIDGTGLNYVDFKDGAFKFMEISDDYYYCGFKYRAAEKVWIICAIPYEEITGSIIMILIPMLFLAFVILATLVLSYAMILREYRQTGKNGVRRFFIKKSRALVVFSMLTLLVLSMYIHLLYATSVQESINRQDAKSLAYSLNNVKDDQAKIKKRYSSFLLNIAGVSARVLSDNPGLASRQSLSELNEILRTSHMLLYDKNGVVVVSDSTYKGLTLSKNPEDPSYQFRQLLYGTPYVLQDEPDEDYLEKPFLYVGSLITDDEGDPNGFVQLAVDPAFFSDPLTSSSKEYILSTYSGTNSSHVFAVDSKSQEYSYHPRTTRIGKAVVDFGISPQVLRDGYVGYLTVRGVRYLGVSAASNNDYVFIVTPADNLMTENFRKAFLTFLPCFVAVGLLYLLLIFESGRSVSEEINARYKKKDRFRSDDALKKFLKSAFLVFSGVVFVITVFHSKLLPEDSIFSWIIGGAWENGVHLFSITWCVICICSVGFVTTCLNMLLLQLEYSLSSRGKTMTHMLMSLLKYGALIGVVFSCAKRLGVQTDTLLASAGILTVVIGLGAQSLTSDVFDGLFIIIEGAFHVGDVIEVDGCKRAKVLEIGIRNTRLLDLDFNNIKIMNNNSLKHVINHSIRPECIFLSIGIDYDEDIAGIEEIIKRELPEMKKNIPLAVDGPNYLGVEEFQDSAVMLRFGIKCRIEDYYPVKRGLNRELKLMFDRNGISVPFAQVVLSDREKEDGNGKPSEKSKGI